MAQQANLTNISAYEKKLKSCHQNMNPTSESNGSMHQPQIKVDYRHLNIGVDQKFQGTLDYMLKLQKTYQSQRSNPPSKPKPNLNCNTSRNFATPIN